MTDKKPSESCVRSDPRQLGGTIPYPVYALIEDGDTFVASTAGGVYRLEEGKWVRVEPRNSPR